MKTDLECQLQVIAENIKWFRKSKGLKQKELAEATGINLRYLQEYEAGKQNITIESILKIADALDISPCELNVLSRIILDTPLDHFFEMNHRQLEEIDIAVAARDDWPARAKLVHLLC